MTNKIICVLDLNQTKFRPELDSLICVVVYSSRGLESGKRHNNK